MTDTVEQPIFVFLSSEIQSLLHENSIDLLAELQDRGLDVKKTNTPNPAPDEQGTRDVALVLLASAAVVGSVGWAIATIVDALSRRPVIANELECVPALDGNGQPIRESGRVVMQWKEGPKLVESNANKVPHQREVKAALGTGGFKFKLSSK